MFSEYAEAPSCCATLNFMLNVRSKMVQTVQWDRIVTEGDLHVSRISTNKPVILIRCCVSFYFYCCGNVAMFLYKFEET